MTGQTLPTLLEINGVREKWGALNEKESTMEPQQPLGRGTSLAELSPEHVTISFSLFRFNHNNTIEMECIHEFKTQTN